MRSFRLLATLGGLLALLPLIASAGPPPQKGLQTVRFNTFNLDAATVAAQAHGYFAAQGINLQVTITPNSTDQMRGLSQGNFDVVSTAFDNVLAWSGREGATIVAVLQRGTPLNLPVYIRPEIRDWDDLRGKPLAVDAVDTAYALVLRRVLLAHGLDMDRGDYTLVPVGGRREASLARGDTYAGILSTQEEAQAQTDGLVRITDYTEVLPDYPDGVYAVTRTWGEAHRDLVERFIRAWLAGARWAQDNPQPMIELLSATTGLPRAGAEQQVIGLYAEGRLNLPGLQNVLDLRTEFGFTLPMGTDLSRFYDTSYFAQATGGAASAR
ncbi:MAG TPA: ABC transporter substrate-binding protein [Chloroflexota bacterium]|jgi:ABC-type nitrate/sulfonate/bicarbonate transport system substrate-binding protein